MVPRSVENPALEFDLQQYRPVSAAYRVGVKPRRAVRIGERHSSLADGSSAAWDIGSRIQRLHIAVAHVVG